MGDILAATDEDDHDPALMDVYDLTLDKTVTNTGPYGQDSIVNYQITVTNEGNTIASGIQVTDDAQLGLSFVSSDAGSNPNVTETGSGIWSITSLVPGATEIINVIFIVTSNFQGSSLTNTASITLDDGDDADSDPD